MAENTTSPWGLPYPGGVGKVNLGATDFNELATKLNTIFNEKFLVVKTSAVEITAKAGELVEMTLPSTVNLPKAAAANTTIGVFAAASPIVVKTTSGEHIWGDFLGEVATSCKLLLFQHIIVQYDGTRWLIVAGQPTNENVYGAQTSRAFGTEYEPSANRPTFVTVVSEKVGAGAPKLVLFIKIGGVLTHQQSILNNAEEGDYVCLSFICPPKVKWKAEQGAGGEATLLSSYLTM